MSKYQIHSKWTNFDQCIQLKCIDKETLIQSCARVVEYIMLLDKKDDDKDFEQTYQIQFKRKRKNSSCICTKTFGDEGFGFHLCIKL